MKKVDGFWSHYVLLVYHGHIWTLDQNKFGDVLSNSRPETYSQGGPTHRQVQKAQISPHSQRQCSHYQIVKLITKSSSYQKHISNPIVLKSQSITSLLTLSIRCMPTQGGYQEVHSHVLVINIYIY